MEPTAQVLAVYTHWNKHGGKPWKSHKKLASEIIDAIELRLKDYSVDDLKKAITNYAQILKSREYTWSYAWTIREFLTRHRPDDSKELQLYRFLDHSFEADDHLTPEARRHRAILNRAIVKPQDKVENPVTMGEYISGLSFPEAVEKYKEGDLMRRFLERHRDDYDKIKEYGS